MWGEGCSGGAKEEGGCRHFYFGSPWLLDSVPPHTPRELPARSSPPTPHPPGPARGPWTPARQGPTPEPHGGTQGHQGPASSPKAKWQQPSQCPCRAVPCRAVPCLSRAGLLASACPPHPGPAGPILLLLPTEGTRGQGLTGQGPSAPCPGRPGVLLAASGRLPGLLQSRPDMAATRVPGPGFPCPTRRGAGSGALSRHPSLEPPGSPAGTLRLGVGWGAVRGRIHLVSRLGLHSQGSHSAGLTGWPTSFA